MSGNDSTVINSFRLDQTSKKENKKDNNSFANEDQINNFSISNANSFST